MNSPYDDQSELDAFRQHLDMMGAYYKRTVAERCAERLHRDFAAAAQPALPRRRRLLQAGKQALGRLVRALPLAGQRLTHPSHYHMEPGTVIDADYRVIAEGGRFAIDASRPPFSESTERRTRA